MGMGGWSFKGGRGEKCILAHTSPEVIVLQHLAGGHARVGVEHQQFVEQIDRVLTGLVV